MRLTPGSYHGYLPVIYMVICVDNSHLGALQKTPDPSWLALTVPRALKKNLKKNVPRTHWRRREHNNNNNAI